MIEHIQNFPKHIQDSLKNIKEDRWQGLLPDDRDLDRQQPETRQVAGGQWPGGARPCQNADSPLGPGCRHPLVRSIPSARPDPRFQWSGCRSVGDLRFCLQPKRRLGGILRLHQNLGNLSGGFNLRHLIGPDHGFSAICSFQILFDYFGEGYFGLILQSQRFDQTGENFKPFEQFLKSAFLD